MKVRLALHARNLKSIHKFRPSSPYATVSNYTGDVRDAFVLGQTEAIQFTSSPMWVTPILIDCEYGVPMQVKVSIFDQSSSSSPSTKGDKPMGSAVVFDVDAVLKNNAKGKRSVGGLAARNLPEGEGWIFLQANIVPEGEEWKQLALTIEGRDMSTSHSGRTSSIVKPDTFFEICRKNVKANGGSRARPVYRSEVAKSSSKPKWRRAQINLDWLCDGNINADVQISIFEHRRTGQHKQIAMCMLSVDSLVRFNRVGLIWEGNDAGKIKIVEARVVKDPIENPTIARSSSYQSIKSAKTTSSSYSQSTIRSAKTMHTGNHESSANAKEHSSEPSPVVPGTFTVVSIYDDVEHTSPGLVVKKNKATKRKVRSKSLDAVVPDVSEPSSYSKCTSSPRHKNRRKPRSSSFDQVKNVEQNLRVSPTDKKMTEVKKRLSFDTVVHYSPHSSQEKEADVDRGEEEAIQAAAKAIQVSDQLGSSQSGGNIRSSIGSNRSNDSAAKPTLSLPKPTRRRTASAGASSSSTAQAHATTSRAGSLDVASSLLTSTGARATRSSVKSTPMSVELLLHARNLKNLSKLTGVSDPYATITLIDPLEWGAVRVLGTTEVVDNCLSPVWCNPVTLQYVAKSIACIEVKIFDKNNGQDDKEMGAARFDVGAILSSKTCMKAKRLEKGGWIFVRAETLTHISPQKDVIMTLEGKGLKNVEGMMKGVSDPFFVLYRKDGGDDWRSIYRSEHIPNNLNPKWEQARVNFRRLCGNNDSEPFRMTVYDYEKSGRHRDMGSLETTVEGLISAYGFDSFAKPLELKKDGKSFGQIVVKRVYISTSTAPSSKKRSSSTTKRWENHLAQNKTIFPRNATASRKEEQFASIRQREVGASMSVNVPSRTSEAQDVRGSGRLVGNNDQLDLRGRQADIINPAGAFAPAIQPPGKAAAVQEENHGISESTGTNEVEVDARSGFMAIFRALQLSEEQLSANSSRVLRSKDAIDTIGSTFRNIGGPG